MNQLHEKYIIPVKNRNYNQKNLIKINSSLNEEDIKIRNLYLEVFNFDIKQFLGKSGLIDKNIFINYTLNDIFDFETVEDIINYELIKIIPIWFPHIMQNIVYLLPRNLIVCQTDLFEDIIMQHLKNN